MRRRLYLSLPDSQSARKVASALLMMRLRQRHIHFMAKPGTDIRGLHEANIAQKTDEIYGGTIGMLLTGAAGLLIGIGVYIFGLGDYQPSWIVIPGLMLFGMLFGSWSGSLIGTAISNPRLEKFQREMEAGRILLMADLPREEYDEIRQKLLMHHPEVTEAGENPGAPAYS